MSEILPTLSVAQYTEKHYLLATQAAFSEVVGFRNGSAPKYSKRATGLKPIGAVQYGPAHWRVYF